ncbi:MAG: TVP38/TMEM64 family protein, partial [Bacillota bacterium]|nr:TVP38/TMEM64 family protein [Bacillota bacterium]
MDKTELQNKRSKKALAILKLLLLLAVVFGVPAYIYFAYPDIFQHLESLEDVVALLERNPVASVLIYLGLQVVQIIVSVLPGQVIQFSAGYLYGVWLGYLYSIIGVALGTVITYYLARLLGRDAMYVLFGEKKFHQFVELMKRKRAHLVIFVIYLIPGIPKDLMSYAAGVTELKLGALLLLCLAGRTPAMLGSLVIGHMTRNANYTDAIILSVIAIVLFAVCMLKRKELMAKIDTLHDKFSGTQ